MNRTKGWVWAALVAALLMIPGGLFTLGTAGDIHCGPNPVAMMPGSRCERPLAEPFTYEQKLAENHRIGWAAFVIGLAMLLVAGYLVRELRRHRRSVAGATAGAAQSWNTVVAPLSAPQSASEQTPAALAAAYRLGESAEFHQANKRVRQIVVLSVVSAIAVGVAAFFHYAAAVDSTVFIGVPLLMDVLAAAVLVPLLWNLFRSPLLSVKARQRGYHLYAEGLVEVGRSGTLAGRWDQVVTFYEEQFLSRNGSAVDYWAELNFADGSRITMNSHSADMRTLLPCLRRAVAEIQLPKARAYMQRGGAVDFGDYAVTPTGLSIGGAPEVAWSEVMTATAELEPNSAERLVIKGRTGWRAVSSKPTRMIPNICTFLAIASGYIVPNAPNRVAF